MHRHRIGERPDDSTGFCVPEGRAFVLDRDPLDAAREVGLPVGLRTRNSVDCCAFVVRQVAVPAEVHQHLHGELGVAVLDLGIDRVDALCQQVVPVPLDAAAREIFYDPDALSVHRANLIRAELIEDSVTAHAALRKRNQGVVDDQIAQSREKVAAALTSLEGAFDAAEERAANILLTQVDVASSTAETLLAPRQKTPQPQEDHP